MTMIGVMIGMSNKLTVPFKAIGKPRMPNKTAYYAPFALRYWEWKDAIKWEAKAQNFEIGDQIAIRATFKMPKSWNKSKQLEMNHKRHQQKPDFDNIAKAVCDALHADDKRVFFGLSMKVWGDRDEIEIVNLSDDIRDDIERMVFDG